MEKGKKNGYCTITYGDKIVYKGILGEDKRYVEGNFKWSQMTVYLNMNENGLWTISMEDDYYTWPNQKVWYQSKWI
jgi:hypothetical protein